MAERDATVRRGSQPHAVTRLRAVAGTGETPSEQDGHAADEAAGTAAEDDLTGRREPAPGVAEPGASGGAQDAAGEAPGGAREPVAGPGDTGAAGSPPAEEPTPEITGTDEPGRARDGASRRSAEAASRGRRVIAGETAGADLDAPAAPSAAPANTESDDAGPPAGSGIARRPAGELVRIYVPFPTEESLAQQGEDADELRREIDELRQLLDVDAVPPLPPPARRRRRGPIVVLTGVVVALLAAGAIALVTAGDDEPGTAAPRPSASPGPATGPSAGPNSTAPAADPTLPAPLTPAAGTAPASGPGVTEPGTLLVVRIADDQTLQVTEQAILDGPATSQVSLTLPGVQRLGGDIAALTPQVSELRAALDGTPAAVRAAGPGSWFVPVGGEVTRIQVSYVVSGAVLPSRPSETGRALGLVSPLLGAGLADRELPLIVRTAGTQVVGSSCPDAPAALQLCGVGDEKGNWTATVPASASRVVVLQVDLPGLA